MSAAKGWPKSADTLEAEGWQAQGWGNCKSCGSRIVWALTPPKKDLMGNVVGGRTGTPLVEVEPPEGSEDRYFESHFADCPNADAHRRAGR